jgi:iron complex transport system permease protein
MAALALSAFAFVVTVVVGTAVGPASPGLGEVVAVLLDHLGVREAGLPALTDRIVWEIRLPRVLLAGVVGATLAYSGAAYQGVFRNPLADPYLLGAASGAGLAASLVFVAPVPVLVGPVSLVTLAAFGGAVAAVLAAYLLASVGGTTPRTTLILAGVAVSSLAVSATSYLMLMSRENTMSILAWLLGSFNASGWHKMWFILPYAAPAAIIVALHGRILNVLQLEEEQAAQLGVNVELTRAVVILAASLATAAAVAVAGIIGFVGLVVPHAVRLVLGPDYRLLVPVSALVGGSFLILCDLGARTLISPGEVPIGVITSFLGAPFFLYLLKRQRTVFM